MRLKGIKYLWGFLVVLAVFACSGENSSVSEEFSTPEKTYRFWLEVTEKGDIANSIRCVSEDSKKMVDEQLTHMSDFMDRTAANLEVFKTYSIYDQKIKEDRAVVLLKGEKGDTIVVPLKREDDGWKVDLLAMFGGNE